MGKAEVIAAKEIYDVAQQRAKAELEKIRSEMDAVRDESQALGAIKLIDYDLAHKKMLKFAALYQLKEKKEYKKGGMTWVEFCESIDESANAVDKILKDLRPLYEAFSAKLADFLGLPFNKIRYLGQSKSAKLADFKDGCLIFDGQKIPIKPENIDEIEAAIDEMKESQRIESDVLKKDVDKLKNHMEKIVKEETKTLTSERDALIEQNNRLKVFDPADKDHKWSVEQMEIVQKTALEFTAACRRFKMDKRIADDMHIQGQVEGLMSEVAMNFRMLRKEWDEMFPLFED